VNEEPGQREEHRNAQVRPGSPRHPEMECEDKAPTREPPGHIKRGLILELFLRPTQLFSEGFTRRDHPCAETKP